MTAWSGCIIETVVSLQYRSSDDRPINGNGGGVVCKVYDVWCCSSVNELRLPVSIDISMIGFSRCLWE
eukprot:scaffold161504_cov43-Attheya_sp.AAC.1